MGRRWLVYSRKSCVSDRMTELLLLLVITYKFQQTKSTQIIHYNLLVPMQFVNLLKRSDFQHCSYCCPFIYSYMECEVWILTWFWDLVLFKNQRKIHWKQFYSLKSSPLLCPREAIVFYLKPVKQQEKQKQSKNMRIKVSVVIVTQGPVMILNFRLWVCIYFQCCKRYQQLLSETSSYRN